MRVLAWLLDPEATAEGQNTHLLPRWILLRCLGLIYFSAFYSLIFQIRGLIGPEGILPAREYLQQLTGVAPGWQHFWYAPTLLWLGSGNHALMLLCWVGLLASVAVVFNLWPRLSLFVCWLCFLSFVTAAQDFSNYQSDGMLLEAGFLSLWLAPRGVRPGLGAGHLPSRVARFLLLWEWFRIYFESGVVKLASGDKSWRNLTAMDDYYQNGPLPTWIGWYVQHLPHWFHAGTVILTFVMELGIAWMMFLPRRWRIVCFWIVTPFQIGIILTANYTFLNYLVLVLGFLLLDDGHIRKLLPARWHTPAAEVPARTPALYGIKSWVRMTGRGASAFVLAWVFFSSTSLLLATIPGAAILPLEPAQWLEPLRIANRYGLFAVMTHERYEIEFQGTMDGQNWVAYPFRYKPQDIYARPGIYAPYQPRFEWNLWFASLGGWRDNIFVLRTQERLLKNAPDVLALFSGNPFPNAPPKQVRSLRWQYWFTDIHTKGTTGAWWRREYLGLYGPPLEYTPDGKLVVPEQQP